VPKNNGEVQEEEGAHQLDAINAWRKASHRDDAAVWHLFSGCSLKNYGIAYEGVLCSHDYGSGLSVYDRTNTWRWSTHEIGHNFGGQHTFENGEGKTGGIMDYGDGKHTSTGKYMFLDTNKNQICTHISNTLYYKSSYWWSSSYSSVCANSHA